jgi:hypothetical protein
MTTFMNSGEVSGLSVKLWRGERMCLIGMDVDQPDPDFVGFSIEVRSPGQATFEPLRNRLNFAYANPVYSAVDGFRNFPSTQAPFQKFRWIHFPYDPRGGNNVYRVTKQQMRENDRLLAGSSIKGSNAKKNTPKTTAALTLQKPTSFTEKPAWFEESYKEGSQAEKDRKIFSH